jgi:RNA polymerase sigma-70 factor (ECF subfamily)
MLPLWKRPGRTDPVEMERIVRTHYDDVWRFCARRLGPDLAPDAAQETFVTAQKRMHEFEGRSELKTWLFGIALNHCRNLSRKRKPEVPVDWLADTASEPRHDGTDDRILDRETLRCALAKLTSEHREVVLLHEVDGLTYQEAADLLGIPVGTVKSRLHHAFLQLRTSMRGAEEAWR